MKVLNEEERNIVSGGCQCFREYTVVWEGSVSGRTEADLTSQCRRICCVNHRSLGVDRFRSGGVVRMC